MEAKLSRTWQDSYERWKAPVAIGVVVVAFVLGLVGWRLTDETLGVGDVLYNTLAMFALNFGHDGPIHWVLDVARFLAAVVVYWAAFAVAIKVISRGSPVRRAAKLKRHVVLMGDTDEVAPIAGRYRDAGREVVVVGALGSQDVEFLRRRHVVVVPLESENDLSSRDLRRIISSAERVVVVGDDETAPRLAARVRDGSAVTPPTTLLVDTGEFAAFWAHEHGDVTLCRSTQAAIALLRVHPPFLETAMVPPPVVLGDSAGTMAAEIVRRIVTGWQQPGERVTVHCLASDAEWVERVRVGLGGRADLRLEVVAPLASSAGRAVADIVAAWPRPDAAKFSVAGPRVYVAYADVSVSVLVASAIAEAVPDANVIGVVDNALVWVDSSTSTFRVVSRLALLSEPDTIELHPGRLLAGELVADAGRWPSDVPSALGRVARADSGLATLDEQPEPVRRAAVAVAEKAADILAAGGLRLEARAWAAEPVFLLAPDQVSAIADALGRALGSPVPVADRETRLRHLEMAARLPILAARAGWTPVATRGTAATLSPEDLQRLALLAHEGYKSVSAATNNATGSANFRKEWDQLAEVDQRSNIAQVADIPVKLATLGLTWRSASEPVPFTFTNEQVEELAENEHRRWVHFQYRNGRPGHQWNQTWAQLLATAEQNKANGEPEKDPARYDRNAVLAIAPMLASVGLEIVAQGAVPRV